MGRFCGEWRLPCGPQLAKFLFCVVSGVCLLESWLLMQHGMGCAVGKVDDDIDGCVGPIMSRVVVKMRL